MCGGSGGGGWVGVGGRGLAKVGEKRVFNGIGLMHSRNRTMKTKQTTISLIEGSNYDSYNTLKNTEN